MSKRITDRVDLGNGNFIGRDFDMPDEVVTKQTDGSFDPTLPGGSGSSPVKRAWFRGPQAAVASGFRPLPFVYSLGDTDIFDLTDPTTPLALAAGTLAVTINVCAVVSTGTFTGHSFYAELDLDENNDDATASATGSLDIGDLAASTAAQISIACTYFVPAGGTVQAFIKHEMTDPLTVWLEAAVQWQSATAEH